MWVMCCIHFCCTFNVVLHCTWNLHQNKKKNLIVFGSEHQLFVTLVSWNLRNEGARRRHSTRGSVMAFSGLIIIQKTQGLCGVKAGRGQN